MTAVIGTPWEFADRLTVNHRKVFRYWPMPTKVRETAFALSGEKEAFLQMGRSLHPLSPQRLAAQLITVFNCANAQPLPSHEFATFHNLISSIWRQTRWRDAVTVSATAYQVLCKYAPREREAARTGDGSAVTEQSAPESVDEQRPPMLIKDWYCTTCDGQHDPEEHARRAELYALVREHS